MHRWLCADCIRLHNASTLAAHCALCHSIRLHTAYTLAAHCHICIVATASIIAVAALWFVVGGTVWWIWCTYSIHRHALAHSLLALFAITWPVIKTRSCQQRQKQRQQIHSFAYCRTLLAELACVALYMGKRTKYEYAIIASQPR